MNNRQLFASRLKRFGLAAIAITAACGSPVERGPAVFPGSSGGNSDGGLGGTGNRGTGGSGGSIGLPEGGRGGAGSAPVTDAAAMDAAVVDARSGVDAAVVDARSGVDAAVNAPANKPPVVTVAALPPADVFADIPVALVGNVSDDGMPANPGLVTSQWSKTSGPGEVIFSSTTAAATSAKFSAPGSYVLRLTGNDGAAKAFAEITATVAPASARPVSWLPFNENQGTATADSVPNNPTATVVNNAVWTPGKSGSAILCSGQAKTVIIPHSVATDLSRGDLTISLWLRSSTPGVIDRYPMILTKDGTSERFEMLLQTIADKPTELLFKYKIASGSSEETGAPFPIDGQWHHIAARRRGAVISLSIDGALKSSFSLTFTPGVNIAPLWVCGFAESWGQFFGAVDDLRIYGRALEDTEIALLHSGMP